MKWRNQFLALVCLLLFAALGVLYFRNWVVQKPFAVILFIGEGLTAQRAAATRVYAGGADTPLAIDALEYSARLCNYSADFAVPDAAAAASALATGAKVKNGTLSVDDAGKPLPTILEIAHKEGRATGLVTDGEITNPTTAAFYGHSPATKSELAAQLLEHGGLDVVLGGGAAEFQNESEAVRVVRTLAELEELSGWQRGRVLGLFARNDLPFSDELAARTDQPSLTDMVRRAIQLLEISRRGYVLIVNAHLMASAAWQNLGERTLRETAELDRAVRTAREYAGTNALIVVAGDAAIGGMNVSGYPFRYDRGVAILGLNSSGQPWITWATGPNGMTTTAGLGATVTEPSAVQVPAALNTIEDPIAAASGPGAEKLHGTIESTAIFALLREAL